MRTFLTALVLLFAIALPGVGQANRMYDEDSRGTILATDRFYCGTAIADFHCTILQIRTYLEANPVLLQLITDLDTEAELEAQVTDVTNFITGVEIDTEAKFEALVAALNFIISTEMDTEAELEALVAGLNFIISTEIDSSAKIITLAGDVTGTGVLVASTDPLLDLDTSGRIQLPGASTLPATCTAPTDFHVDTDATTGQRLFVCETTDTWVLQGDGSVPGVGEVAAGAYAAASIDGDDVNTNIAGAHLTLTAASPDMLDIDAELSIFSFCVTKLDPATDEEFYTLWRAPTAVTLTEIYAEVTGGTSVAFDFEIDDGTPTGVNGSDVTATTSGVTDSTLAGDTSMADGDRLDIDFGTVTGSVTQASFCIEGTIDD